MRYDLVQDVWFADNMKAVRPTVKGFVTRVSAETCTVETLRVTIWELPEG